MLRSVAFIRVRRGRNAGNEAVCVLILVGPNTVELYTQNRLVHSADVY